MATVKRTVTLDEELARKAAKMAPNGNLSAFVNEALERHVSQEGLQRLMEEDIRIRGPIDPVIAAQVDAELDAIDREDLAGRSAA